jgi:hypothetical protein
MPSRGNYSPVSGQTSSRLRLVSGYLIGSGILTLAFVVLGLGVMLLGKPATTTPVPVRLVNIGIRTAIATGWIIAGVLLGRALRIGGIIALLMLMIPVISIALLHEPVARLTLVLAVIGVGLVLSVFAELK